MLQALQHVASAHSPVYCCLVLTAAARVTSLCSGWARRLRCESRLSFYVGGPVIQVAEGKSAPAKQCRALFWRCHLAQEPALPHHGQVHLIPIWPTSRATLLQASPLCLSRTIADADCDDAQEWTLCLDMGLAVLASHVWSRLEGTWQLHLFPSGHATGVGCAAEPMEKVKGLGEAALSSEDGHAALGLHERLSADLAAHENAKVKEWHGVMAETSDQKLKLPLLRSESLC